jgi:hypothetical protein
MGESLSAASAANLQQNLVMTPEDLVDLIEAARSRR